MNELVGEENEHPNTSKFSLFSLIDIRWYVIFGSFRKIIEKAFLPVKKRGVRLIFSHFSG